MIKDIKWLAYLVAAIAVVALLRQGYVYVYNQGYDKANTEWTAKYKKDVGVLNDKIISVEKESKHLYSEYETRAKQDATTIDSLNTKIQSQKDKYNTLLYSKEGTVVCNVLEIRLGPDFSADWNTLYHSSDKGE